MNIPTSAAIVLVAAIHAATAASVGDESSGRTHKSALSSNAGHLQFYATATRAVQLLDEARDNDGVVPAPASASASASDESHAADAVAAGGRRGGDRGLRLLGENVSNPALQLQEELDQCRADLNELRKKQDAPALFFVQMASSCKMKAKTRKNGKVYYEWSSKEMDDETYSFTDRP